MKVDNNKPDDNKSREPINSSQLSYIDNMSRSKPISKVADNSPIDRSQHIFNKTLTLIFSPQTQDQVNNNDESNSKQQLAFNINLPYNINHVITQNS